MQAGHRAVPQNILKVGLEITVRSYPLRKMRHGEVSRSAAFDTTRFRT